MKMWKKLLMLGIAGIVWPAAGSVAWIILAVAGCVFLPWEFPGRSWLTNSYESFYMVTFSGTFICWIAAPLYLLVKSKLER